jgi:hypothetical protein
MKCPNCKAIRRVLARIDVLSFLGPSGRLFSLDAIRDKPLMKIPGSYLPIKVAIAKFFAGVITIGGGCSLGREGPTVHIAGALASNIAGMLGVAQQGRRPALLSGAAAELAAAFNTPLSKRTPERTNP